MRLNKKVLELTQSVSYGSVTLKSLQNDNMPELDLLVREAIQNSSDASLKQDGDSFTVKFNTGFFNPAQFNANLTDIENVLDGMFPEDNAEFLEIRDTKTEGLTGPLRIREMPTGGNHGNFFKLIFDTGKKQTQTGAGGNWGFGKSVYYRVGMGIVVFYSRIKTEIGYESRLIITLVENEESSNAILANISERSAGKAWWGIEDGEDFLPLTNDSEIEEILNVFNLPTFKNDETGTSVIIPYIKTQELLKNIIPVEANISDDVRARCTWATNFEEYLTLSIQKWYAPKIQNRHLKDFCNKKWLRVYVNNNPIRYDSMLPFFKLVQELYTMAIAKTYDSEYNSEWINNARCLNVNINNYFNTVEGNSTAGYVAAVRINTADLYGGQNYMDPCIYTRHFDEDPDINEPMVMYARDPGMVIEYAIDKSWVKGIAAPNSSDEYIFAFFVPITHKKLKSDLSEHKYAGMELGEYLRECEASDHMGWDDPANMRVVERIQKNTASQISSTVASEKAEYIDAAASKLSGKLGRKLLPKVGYGRSKTGGGGGSGGGSGTKINNIEFSVLSKSFEGSELILEYELKLLHGKKTAEYTLLVDSEGGLIDPNSWNGDIGTGFPIEISQVSVNKLSSSVESEKSFTDMLCNCLKTKAVNDYVELSMCIEAGAFIGFKIVSEISSPTIKGSIKLKTTDKKYRPAYKIM